MVRHPLDAYLQKFILLGKEFVLLCKMIEKQQEISSCRSTNKVSCYCSWYPKILRQRMVLTPKIGLLKSKKRS